MLMRQEYERYKDLWGTNLHYSHSAGPAQNYSELKLKTLIYLFISAAKKSIEFQIMHIYFDTPTFDQVEKDVKVGHKNTFTFNIHFVTSLIR